MAIDHVPGLPAMIIVALLSSALIGCAKLSGMQPLDDDQSFARSQAESVFVAGYGALTERYIVEIDAESLAINGLRGLTDLDPTLAVGRVGDAVDISARGKTVASFATPKARDVNGWAKLSVRVWRAARSVSPIILTSSQEDIYEAVFDRAMRALDPHARYATAEEAGQNRRRRDGYHGVGIAFDMQDGVPKVVEVTGRGPAERAGVRVGDIVLRINGQTVDGLSFDAITGGLQDDVPGWMTLTVYRPGRGTLRLPVLRSYMIPETVEERYDDGVLYLRIRHSNQGTSDRIRDTLAELTTGLKDRLRGLILDLRGNPGGLLQQSVKLADLFLASGPVLATRGRHPDSIGGYSAGGEDALHGLPLLILIDGDTASAAELAAAALQERRRAAVVGSSSFGKGIVQTVVPLPNGGELSFPWSRATLPSGRVLGAEGVRPAVCTSGLYVTDPQSIDQLVRPGAHPPSTADALGCTAEEREGMEVDLELARRLIDDSRLYAAVLDKDPVFAEGRRPAVP
jgi:carboxyl-terminal processing protease